jgi:hypothetical protein
MTVEFSRQLVEKHSNIKFHENPSSGSRVVSCGLVDGQTDMTKLIFAFRNFTKAAKKKLGQKISLKCIHFGLFIFNTNKNSLNLILLPQHPIIFHTVPDIMTVGLVSLRIPWSWKSVTRFISNHFSNVFSSRSSLNLWRPRFCSRAGHSGYSVAHNSHDKSWCKL